MSLPLYMGFLHTLKYYHINVQEAVIEEYFKPEEKTMREMMKAMQTQALLERAEAEKSANEG